MRGYGQMEIDRIWGRLVAEWCSGGRRGHSGKASPADCVRIVIALSFSADQYPNYVESLFAKRSPLREAEILILTRPCGIVSCTRVWMPVCMRTCFLSFLTGWGEGGGGGGTGGAAVVVLQILKKCTG